LQANGMAKDFSWHRSAKEYVVLYESAQRAGLRRSGVARLQSR